MTENINYNQYLRDNPMPTKPLNKKAFKTVAMYCLRNDSTNSRNDRW